MVSKQYFQKRKRIDDTQLQCAVWVETISSTGCDWLLSAAAVSHLGIQLRHTGPHLNVHVWAYPESRCAQPCEQQRLCCDKAKAQFLECAHDRSTVRGLSEHQIRACRLLSRTASDPCISPASHTACWLVARNVLRGYILTALVTLLQGSATRLKAVEKHFIEALFCTGRAVDLIPQAVNINCMWQMSLSWAFIFKYYLSNRKR